MFAASGERPTRLRSSATRSLAAGPGRPQPLSPQQWLGNDAADTHPRVERGIGVLKHDLHVLAIGRERVMVVPEHLPVRTNHTAGRCQHPCGHAPDRGFSRAALAHEPQRFSGKDRKADIVHRPHEFRTTALKHRPSFLESDDHTVQFHERRGVGHVRLRCARQRFPAGRGCAIHCDPPAVRGPDAPRQMTSARARGGVRHGCITDRTGKGASWGKSASRRKSARIRRITLDRKEFRIDIRVSKISAAARAYRDAADGSALPTAAPPQRPGPHTSRSAGRRGVSPATGRD